MKTKISIMETLKNLFLPATPKADIISELAGPAEDTPWPDSFEDTVLDDSLVDDSFLSDSFWEDELDEPDDYDIYEDVRNFDDYDEFEDEEEDFVDDWDGIDELGMDVENAIRIRPSRLPKKAPGYKSRSWKDYRCRNQWQRHIKSNKIWRAATKQPRDIRSYELQDYGDLLNEFAATNAEGVA